MTPADRPDAAVASPPAAVPLLWYRWLQAVVIGVMAFGLSMLLAPETMLRFFSALLYASTGAIEGRFSAEAVRYIVLVHGVLGAVMFGWGVLMWLVLRGPFRRGQAEGWTMIAVPLLAWCVPDTLFSLLTGFWQNAVLNAVFFVSFAVPLAASRKFFKSSPSA